MQTLKQLVQLAQANPVGTIIVGVLVVGGAAILGLDLSGVELGLGG